MPPEAAFVITLTDEGVRYRRPDGKLESVAWDDLQAVLIETSDAGPIGTDVYWILAGKHGGCVIPQGATGEDALLERLQALEGFDNDAVIAAMSSTDNQRFVCWRRMSNV
jgi:hypothetical protein